MNVILGATGQIGAYVIDKLLEYNQPVRIVVHNKQKTENCCTHNGHLL